MDGYSRGGGTGCETDESSTSYSAHVIECGWTLLVECGGGHFGVRTN